MKKLRKKSRKIIAAIVAACLITAMIPTSLVLAQDQDGWYVNGQHYADVEGVCTVVFNVDPADTKDITIQYKVNGQPITFNDNVNHDLGVSQMPSSGSAGPQLSYTTGTLQVDTIGLRVHGFASYPGTTCKYQPMSLYTHGPNPRPQEAVISRLAFEFVVSGDPLPVNTDGIYINGSYIASTLTLNVDPGSVADVNVQYKKDGEFVTFTNGGYTVPILFNQSGSNLAQGRLMSESYGTNKASYQVGFNQSDAGNTYSYSINIYDWPNTEPPSNPTRLAGITIKFVVSNNTTGVTSTVDLTGISDLDHVTISATSSGYPGILENNVDIRAGAVITLQVTVAAGFHLENLKVLDKAGNVLSYIYKPPMNSPTEFYGQFYMPLGGAFVQAGVVQNAEIAIPSFEHGRLELSVGTPMAGRSVSLKVLPEAGYQLNFVRVKNADGQVIKEYTEPKPKTYLIQSIGFHWDGREVTIEAAFVKRVLRLETVVTGNGTIEFNTPTYDDNGNTVHGTVFGDTVTVTLHPETGYQLKEGSFKVTSPPNYNTPVEFTGSGNTYQFVTPKMVDYSYISVHAAFEKATYNVTWDDTQNGQMQVDKQSAQMGETVTFSITPKDGFTLKAGSIKANGGAVTLTDNGNETYSFVMPGESVAITAVFEKIDYDVTINTFNGGSITSNLDTAQIGDTVTLTVTPQSGYQLKDGGLKVNGGTVPVIDNGDGTYSFTMPAGTVDITAVFEKANYSIVIGHLTGGSLTANLETAQMGDTVTITVTAQSGYQFVAGSLQVNGGAVEVTDNGDGTYAFTMPAGAVEITAEFKELPTEPTTEPVTNPSDATEPDRTTQQDSIHADGTESPKTGDAISVAVSFLMLAAAGGIILAKRKKH